MADNSFTTPVVKRIRSSINTPSTGSPATWEIPPTPCLKSLGFGTGVNVMLYVRSPRCGLIRSPWAIKKLRQSHAKTEIATRLDEEAKILKKLKHPNIIGYRGYKRSADGVRVLAIENGHRALYDMIEDLCDSGSTSPMPALHINKVTKGIASALHYLHTEQKILHGDLKGANVLIIGDFDGVKICDFGVTLPLDENGVVEDDCRDYVGTDSWSAPEVFACDTITSKTDSWALGCTIFEMITLDKPHFNKLPTCEDSTEEDDEDAEIDDTAYQEALGTRPDLPQGLCLSQDYNNVLSLFLGCTIETPAHRPSPKLIMDILSNETAPAVVPKVPDVIDLTMSPAGEPRQKLSPAKDPRQKLTYLE